MMNQHGIERPGPLVESLEQRMLFSAEFDGPIVITRGGTYSGNWESLDPDVPAVNIKTAEPVIIRNSTIRSRSDLIKASILQGADVTVVNTRGYGLNPDEYGESPGRFLRAEHFSNVLVKNCYMKGTSGMNLYNFIGDPDEGDGVRIVRNRARDIDGRKSDGDDGFLKFDERERLSDGHEEEGYDRVQFVQLNQVQNVPGVVIAWNEIINRPGKSRVEDNISIYRSSGTAQSPIRIHNNYIQGAYNVNPTQSDYVKGGWTYTWEYSGGGIMMGDGDGCGFVRAYDNQIVSTTNYGIAIYAGHDNHFYNNRIVSSGMIGEKRIAEQNVGVYIWDGQDDGPGGFYNNRGTGNLIGWHDDDGDRNDWWVPDATSFAKNAAWSGELTLQTELDEMAVWKAKLAQAGMRVGPAR